MASVVFYFQVHQPHRLRRYSVFDADPFYFDTTQNAELIRKVAEKCYRPATALLLDLIKRHEGRFKVSFALTGTVLEQLEQHAPDVIGLFRRLGDTGCCEFLAETYWHSLSFLYSREEFRQQVERHTDKTRALFGQTPRVFRNTELIYNNDLAHYVSTMPAPGAAPPAPAPAPPSASGPRAKSAPSADPAAKPRFLGAISEGADRILGFRSPNYLYRPPHTGKNAAGKPFAVLLKNYRLSDDIAFRFSNRGWAEWPLSAEKFASRVDQINGDGYVCNLFMDYETFGEHQWADTGIFGFLDALPDKVLSLGGGRNDFLTPSEAILRYEPVGEYDAPHMISWADTERDLSAWLGNAMQSNALNEIFRLERLVKQRLAAAVASGREAELKSAEGLLEDWRRLTTSDHFYYMSTKYWADGDVHKYFSPYESPYDAYINYMNVLDNLRSRATA